MAGNETREHRSFTHMKNGSCKLHEIIHGKKNGGKITVHCTAQYIIRSSQKIHWSELKFHSFININLHLPNYSNDAIYIIFILHCTYLVVLKDTSINPF